MTRLLALFILASLSFGINSKTITEISYVGVPGYDLALGQVLEWSKASVEHNEPQILDLR